MKIVDACRITGRGEALITDEPFTLQGFLLAESKTNARIALEDRFVNLRIVGAEAVLKSVGREFLGFLVPFFDDEALRTLIVNREIEIT